MTQEVDIKTVLDAAGTSAGTRNYAGMFPQGVTLPAVSFLPAQARPITYLNDTATRENNVFGFECWGNTYEEAKNLAVAVRAALLAETARFRAVFYDETPVEVPTPEARCIVITLSIWS